MGFKTLRIEEYANGRGYRVQGKFLGMWWCGFVYTDYFSISYSTREEAMNAIMRYKKRFTEV